MPSPHGLDTCIKLMSDSEEICVQLRQCLESERLALVEFRMEDLLQNNIRKESLLSELLNNRKKIELSFESTFGTKEIAAEPPGLSSEEKALWASKLAQWQKEWDETRERCRSNQKFIKHSLKNLNLFANHLRKVLGVKSTYSKEGKSVEIQTEGKVVEAEL